MFKINIGLPIFVFLFLTVKQLIFESEIQWIDNIIFSVFLFYAFWEWAKKPYDWSKSKEEK